MGNAFLVASAFVSENKLALYYTSRSASENLGLSQGPGTRFGTNRDSEARLYDGQAHERRNSAIRARDHVGRGRYALVFDRLVDLDSGTETVLVGGVAPDFVDHLALPPDRKRAAMVYGSYRISQQVVVLPIRWP